MRSKRKQKAFVVVFGDFQHDRRIDAESDRTVLWNSIPETSVCSIKGLR
jgi:hypothetical protein